MTVWQAPPAWSSDTPTSTTNLNKLSDNERYLKEVLAGTNADKVPNAALASGIDGAKVGWGYRSDYITVDEGMHGNKLINNSVADPKIISLSGNKVGAGINGAYINDRSIGSDKLVTQVLSGEVIGAAYAQGNVCYVTANFSRAFSGNPVITATIKSFSANALSNFTVSASANTTQFTIGINNSANTGGFAGVCVGWVAVGPS